MKSWRPRTARRWDKMVKHKPRAITVQAFVPHGASDDDVAQFVAEALGSWGGGFHPNDPLFSSLGVTQVRIGSKVWTAPQDEQA